MPIFLKTAMLLCFDDNDAALGNALISQLHEAFLDHGRQGGRPQIKPQMHSRGHLVDILSTRTLSADGGNFDFI